MLLYFFKNRFSLGGPIKQDTPKLHSVLGGSGGLLLNRTQTRRWSPFCCGRPSKRAARVLEAMGGAEGEAMFVLGLFGWDVG